MADSNLDPPSKKLAAIVLVSLLMTEAVAQYSIHLRDVRPKKKKKTWIEKQQARRGWTPR